MVATTERRHDEIVDVAEALILRGDPSSVTLADIAEATGLTPAELHHHFPSRDSAIARVQARCLAQLATVVGGVADGDPWVRLMKLAGAFVQWSRREPARYELLARLLVTSEPLIQGPALDIVFPAALRALGPVVSTWQATGVADPAQQTLAMLAALHGALQLGKCARFTPSASGPVLARQLMTALLVSAGASLGAVRACPRWDDAA